MTSAQLAVANLAVETLRVILTSNLSTFQKASLEKVLETLRNIASPDLAASLTTEEHDFMTQGKKIQAIKSVRSRTQTGLREAKDLVEKFYPPSYVPPTIAKPSVPAPNPSSLAQVERDLPAPWRQGCGDPECCPNG